MKAAETKSGATVGTDFSGALSKWTSQRPDAERMLVYAGEIRERRTQAEVLPWSSLHDVRWA